MAVRVMGGRRLLDRAGVALLADAAISTVDHWHSCRAENGFPEHADTDGTWWDEEQIISFLASHRRAKRDGLTVVDRSGDPDELVGPSEAARVLGYKSLGSIPLELRELADEVETLPSGRKRRRYRLRTLWAYADQRTGKYSTGRPRTGAVVDRSGDPDELVGPSEAARVLGYAHGDYLPAGLKAKADRVKVSANGREWRRWKRRTLWEWNTGDAA